MRDTDKKYQNSSPKKTDYSTLIYFLVWLLLSALIITGGVLVFNWWQKRKDIKDFKEYIHNVQDERPKDDEMDRRYENTREKILSNFHQVKKFEDKIAENPKELGIWKEDLEKIRVGLTPYEKLKQVKHDPDQLEEVWLAVYREYLSLLRLSSRLFTKQEVRKQWEDQEKWLEEKADQEAEDAKPLFNELMTHFYHRFRNNLSSELKTPYNIWPVQIEGRPANPNKLKEEINYIVTKYGNQVRGLRHLERKWKGFTGYDIDQKESKENMNIMGITMHDPKEIAVFGSEEKNEDFLEMDGDIFRGTPKEVATEIRLKKELLFSRQNRYYTDWITEFNEEKSMAERSLDISEESLLNTIANELAHAVINSIRFEYEPKNGGHGDLHDDYTDQIEAMIKNDHRWTEFLVWWRKHWNQ